MEQTTQNIIDFNKICRTCLSTENLQPISGFMLADITSIQKGKEEIYIYGCTIQSVLNKYAHIEFDLSDLLPKQICSNCFVKLNNAYTFLKHCNLMNSALTDCLKRVGKSQANVCEQNVPNNLNSEIIKTETDINTSQLNVANSLDSEIKNEIQETTHFKNSLAECLTRFENKSQANVCEKNNTYILDLEIPKTKIHKTNHLNNTALTVHNTSQANVCEQNIANNLDLNIIKNKIHMATHCKSNDSEIDYETEIPMSKIPSHVEKIVREIRTRNITDEPKVVIETFNENCIEEFELIQENNDRIQFENEIQIISDDDSNSGDPATGQKSVVELKSELRKLLTDNGPRVNKKCKLCRKEFRKKTTNKFHSYCECFPRF